MNQLDVVTRSLDFMDRTVTEQEQTIEKLFNTEQVEGVVSEMEERHLMDSQVFSSAWEAHQKEENFEEIPSPDKREFGL